MHIDLGQDLPDPDPTPGINIRTAQTGQDDLTIHALVQNAFDWRERTPQPFEDWKGWMMRSDVYDESLWFLAEKDGEIIGACLCTPYSDMGWIRQLAVNNDYRNQGIGRALLQTAFRELKSRGFPKAGLSVESENPNAYHFYQTAGMVKAVHLDEYVKEIPK
jgi:ribosomal protein S18 acetylase RimI-like enzyme